MSKRTGYVTVAGTIFGPDDKIPAELAKRIDNPKVTGSDSPEPEPTPEPERSEIPPKGGAGSGVEAWKAYATSKDVTVADDATRDEIIAALDDVGIPTE
jgi:hypothetical protein